MSRELAGIWAAGLPLIVKGLRLEGTSMARFLDVHRRGDTTVAEVDRARLLLMLAAPVDRQEVSWRLRGIGVVVEGDQSSTGEPIHQGPSWLWVRAADGVLDDRLQERVGALVGESLERFGPVYRMRGQTATEAFSRRSRTSC